MRYSYFSLYSVFPHREVHPFRNFLAVLSPPTLYKVETGKKILDLFQIHASNFVCGVRGGVGLCVLENTPECKSVPRLLSMVVGLK